MGVVWVKPIPQRTSSFGRGHTRRRRNMWRALVDDDNDNENTIAAYMGLNEGDAYYSWDGLLYDPICTCFDINCNQEESGSRVWIITADYETPAGAPQQKQGQQSDSSDPTEWLPKIKRSYGQIQIVQRKAFDREGNNTLTLAMKNSAGFPFRNLAGRIVRFPVFTHTCYTSEFSEEDHRNYAGALNLTTWNNFEAGKWRLESWEADDVYFGGVKYFLNTRVFHLCPDDLPSWQQFLLQQGTRDVLGNPVLDPMTGLEVTQDWPLDAGGLPLTIADIDVDLYHYDEYPDHKVMEFSFLNVNLLA